MESFGCEFTFFFSFDDLQVFRLNCGGTPRLLWIVGGTVISINWGIVGVWGKRYLKNKVMRMTWAESDVRS